MLEQKNNIESKNEENIITNKSGTNTNILSVLRAKRTTKKHTKKEMNNIIDDKFEFFPHIPLGNGAFSAVFASRDLTDTNKLYAIKFENSLLSNKLKLEKDIYDVMVDWNFLKKEEADKFKEILYDKDKTMKQNLSERKGMEKVALLTNYATKLVQKPWEAATDAVVSLDKWISDLFFGKALRKTKED